MSGALNRLLYPITREHFFANYWGNCHLHISRHIERHFDDVVRLADIDAFFQSELNPSAFVNVVRGGELQGIESWSRVEKSERGTTRLASPERLVALYMEGATLILNRAHKAMPAVGFLVRRLVEELEFEIGANIYVTPPNGQGFSAHADSHEVLVLQLAGTKSWKIHSAQNEVDSVDLKPGDVLYIPRGRQHSAQCDQLPSVHIAIGITPWYGFRLLERLAERAREMPEFGRASPPPFAEEGKKRLYEDDFHRHLQDLVAGVDIAKLIKGFRESLKKTHRTAGTSGLTDLLNLPHVQRSSVVQLRGGLQPLVENKEGNMELINASGSLNIPMYLKSVVEQLLSGKPIRVGDLQGLITPQGKVELAQKLLAGGFLSIISDS